MNKRKIMLLSIALCMVAILAIGGTLAYFTDTDAETNTFTVGKVDIDLVENFDEENAQLFPGKQNAVQKEVWIALEDGSEDCYVWYEWWIPTKLDSTDGSTGLNNIVHVNGYGYTWDTYRENSAYWPEGQTSALPLEQTWDHDPNVELSSLIGPEGFIGTATIGGIEYNKYVVLYHGILSADGQQKTTPAMSQVYLDAAVDCNAEGEYTYKGKVIDYDFTKKIDILVKAFAIQAEGFKDVYEAYTAYQAQVK